jgi:hypothetical protein
MKLNLTKTLNKVTTNKYVLYIVLFFAITNVLGYLMTKDFDSLALFVALGVITSYFTKNMIIILGSAMFITNIAFASKKIREGMKSKEKSKDDSEDEKEGMSPKKKKRDETEEMTTLSPASVKEGEEEDAVDEGPGGRIDYASTMEQAYDNLSNLIGKGGISNLSKETKSLLDQQKQLAGQLESMAPLLKDAKGLLNNMNLPNMKELDGMMAKFGGLANLTGGKK